MWFVTLHWAFNPQVPGQGSKHLLPTQALSRGQSLFNTHSGLQPLYGSPWYSARQVQMPLSHNVFGPQGDGLQGSVFTGGAGSKIDHPSAVVIFTRKCLRVGGLGVQLVKGSPVNPSKHVHIGVWLMTLHWAPIPQDPGQGSTHFSLIQAKLLGHSELILHSGLQFGGLPI